MLEIANLEVVYNEVILVLRGSLLRPRWSNRSSSGR